ncbi:hypothetical protein A4X03_0g8257 [Tilletia caries]|uniref:CCHC-type domain-containing protein n=1 Tax=Tilletia caries TaxID=13290 RepID=A0A8T8SIV1_9BASI|nr:hypothetical protein A4X03_0g8257 [Tilletia caries]
MPASPEAGSQGAAVGPTLIDLMAKLDSIKDDLATQKQELAAQKVALSGVTSTYAAREGFIHTPHAQVGAGLKDQDNPRRLEDASALGLTAGQQALRLGQHGGPYGLSPVLTAREDRRGQGRPSMGVSGFPLPPQASPATYVQRGLNPTAQQPRQGTPVRKVVPRDTDAVMVQTRADLMATNQFYFKMLHPEWTDEQVNREANKRTAEDYLALRKKHIEEALNDNPVQVNIPLNKDTSRYDSGRQDPSRLVFRFNWNMIRYIKKLNHFNWSDWRSRVYSLLGTVPGAIGILEGIIFGPRYLDPNDLSAHPDYDEAMDLELGQVIQSCIDDDVQSLLLKPISDGELRGSFFYRELRTWMVPNQGYAALKLIGKMGRHRQRDDETVRNFGERLRRFYIELQSAGESLDQTKQVGFLLSGVRYRFQTARDSIVSRQAAGEAFGFEKALHILTEAEESFGAFEDRRRPVATRPIPPLSRPSAHVAEEDIDGDECDSDLDEEDVQALAAQLARQFIARRRAQRDNRPFSGACFQCKKVGHRAAECPDVTEANPQTSVPRALLADKPDGSNLGPQHQHTCGKANAHASFAANFPALGAFEAQMWEDELDALPAALNVVTSA